MLQSVISKKENKLGKVLEAVAEPAFQGSENVGESSVIFPEKAVREGDTWTMDRTTNGMNMQFVFKVKSISKTTVGLEVAGTVSGMGTGTITGTMQIERASGVVVKSTITTNVNAGGQEVKTMATVAVTKV